MELKFKRSNPNVDSTSFVLQANIDPEQDPISIDRLLDYIENVLCADDSGEILNISSSTERILLVRCSGMIST